MAEESEAHTLAQLCTPETLAHALTARLTLDGRRELADKLAALFREEGLAPPSEGDAPRLSG